VSKLLLCAVLLVACDARFKVTEQSLSLADPWLRHTIHNPGTLRGADGVDLADVNGDGLLDIATGWEQSSRTTVSLHPGCASARDPWLTTVLPLSTSGVEGAVFGDVDQDGHLDVVSAGSSGFRLYVHFGNGGSSWTGVTIGAATVVQRWLNAAITDVTGDGVPEIVAGGYSTGATIDVFSSEAPRDPAGWTRSTIGRVGALYTLEPLDYDHDGDLDLVVSDRDTIREPVLDYSLRGARVLRNDGDNTWVNVPIWNVGNMQWIHVDENQLVAGVTTPSAPMSIRNWRTLDVPLPENVGQYKAVAPGDIDGDGAQDLVLTFSHAVDSISGVVWLRSVPGGWERGEISGPDGEKWDDLKLYDVDCDGDLDVVTSEEGRKGDPSIPQLGLHWFENQALEQTP
jgi:hypothetical protein